MRGLIEACLRATGATATPIWVPADFLAAQRVSPWSEMPGWIPAEGDTAGFGRLSNQRAVAARLTLRPLVETARDTLAWSASPDLESWVAGDPFGSAASLMRDEAARRRAVRGSGISRDKEARVLAAWKARG